MNGDGPKTARPHWALRAVTGVAALLAAVYVIACVIYNLPNSPVKVRIIGPANAIIMPWFEQDWQLFAPTPATTNDHLLLTARVKAPNGAVYATTPRDVEGPIEDLPRSDHLLPTKQPGITLAMQELFATYRTQLRFIDQNPATSSAARSALIGRLNRRYAPDFDRLRRLLSYEAAKDFRGVRILLVRATFTQTPIVPFSERSISTPPPQKSMSLLRTSWLPYVAHVGS